MNKKLARNIFYIFLLVNIGAVWYFSYTDHEQYKIEMIREFLEGQNMFIALSAYTVIMIIRGLTFLPGTPLLILGAVLFPTWYAVIAIEIAVQCYILVIHKYSEILDFKVPQKILDYEKKVEKYGIPYIMLLCLIPGMSMNMLAYFLSVIKVPLKTKMIGIGLGSIVSIYVYLNIFEAVFEWSV
ncbi:VTT domain-containing protein [Candidatus Gracilibacteria bacterium]|nr:VTT domain-containing protein [Candidatus Gracilibacteria bacterium]